MKKKDQGTKAANTNKGKAASKGKQPENTPGTDQVLEEIAENIPVAQIPATEEINQDLEKIAEEAAESNSETQSSDSEISVENSTDNAPADKSAEQPAKPSRKEAKENPFYETAKAVFASHKEEVSTLHFTQDGTPFIHKQFAKMHAGSLADQRITTITRLEVK